MTEFPSRISFPLSSLAVESAAKSTVMTAESFTEAAMVPYQLVSSTKSSMVSSMVAHHHMFTAKSSVMSFEFAGLSQRDCHGRHQDDEDEAVHDGGVE